MKFNLSGIPLPVIEKLLEDEVEYVILLEKQIAALEDQCEVLKQIDRFESDCEYRRLLRCVESEKSEARRLEHEVRRLRRTRRGVDYKNSHHLAAIRARKLA
jgi:hypothetical protein